MKLVRTRLVPYKMASASAKALAKAMGIKRLRAEGPALRRPTRLVNWGSSKVMPRFARNAWWFNPPNAVGVAGNKLLALTAMSAAGVPVVEFTDDKEKAREWIRLKKEGPAVYARTTLRGTGGDGIVVVSHGRARAKVEIPDAPLYTRAFGATHEYRVHTCGARVFDVQKKRRRAGTGVAAVRNHGNGYVYCREKVEAPEAVKSAAVEAVKCLGLVFGAVDVLCKKDGTVAVLEVNTAPGLEGATVQKYAAALRELTTGEKE